jgi:DNA-directed RNA polymerase specialized sigma24 family protein
MLREEYTQVEIAKELEIDERTVRRVLVRIRKKWLELAGEEE